MQVWHKGGKIDASPVHAVARCGYKPTNRSIGLRYQMEVVSLTYHELESKKSHTG